MSKIVFLITLVVVIVLYSLMILQSRVVDGLIKIGIVFLLYSWTIIGKLWLIFLMAFSVMLKSGVFLIDNGVIVDLQLWQHFLGW